MGGARKIARTDQELARILGVTDRTVRNWRRRGAPRHPDGSYDVARVAAWAQDMRSLGQDRSAGAVRIESRAPLPPDDDEDELLDVASAEDDTNDVPSRRGRGLLERDPLREARTERERLQIELQRIELRRLQGKSIDREEVEEMLAKRMLGFRRELRTAGRRLARILIGRKDAAEIQAIIDRELDRILWSAYGRELELGEDLFEEGRDGDGTVEDPDPA